MTSRYRLLVHILDVIWLVARKRKVQFSTMAWLPTLQRNAEAVSGAHKQSRWCCGDVHEAANDVLSSQNVAEPGTVALLERLHAARCERDEVKVIIDGVKMATIEPEKMVDRLPLERSFALRRKLEVLKKLLENCLGMASDQRTLSQCRVLMTMVMTFKGYRLCRRPL